MACVTSAVPNMSMTRPMMMRNELMSFRICSRHRASMVTVMQRRVGLLLAVRFTLSVGFQAFTSVFPQCVGSLAAFAFALPQSGAVLHQSLRARLAADPPSFAAFSQRVAAWSKRRPKANSPWAVAGGIASGSVPHE